MDESKSAATDRLRREGRWEEASKFRDDKRAEFKIAGMKRTEANNAAWDAMLAEFPPQPTSAPESDGAQRSDAESIAAILARSNSSTADPLGDALWVYDHLGDDDLTPAEFPSLGAWSMWNWSRANRARFFERLWPKADAARACIEGSNDQGHADEALELAEHNEFWMERLADDMADAMNCMTSNALNWDLHPRFQTPQASEEGGRSLGVFLYKLGLRHISNALENCQPT